MKFRIIFIVTFINSFLLFGQAEENFVSFHLKAQSYQAGKVLNVESDYYFDTEKGIMVVHGFIPEENIKISNRFGEVKVYFPKKNSVSLMQDQAFSSKNELLYYFLTNQYRSLGLDEEGFTVVDTHMDGPNQVVTWMAPEKMNNIKKVELVFENDQPIYAAYFNMEGKMMRKIYYYEYQYFRSFMMPRKVAQFTYLTDGDSIIQRSTYTDIKTSYSPTSSFFNFNIPEDAKVVE